MVLYRRQMDGAGDASFHPPTLEDLKAEAPSRGLGNPFHPHVERARRRTVRLADVPDEVHKRTIATHELRGWNLDRGDRLNGLPSFTSSISGAL